MYKDKKLGAFIVPTGVGASIGGFAGDASCYARKIAQDCMLLVNPNVVNAACFSGISENMLYVEGYSLDSFFKGQINLIQSEKNKIGVVFDKAIPQNVLNVHINTINAVKTVYGINITGYEITEEPVGVDFFIDESGSSMGNVKNPKTLKKSALELIKKGAEAIAVVCRFPEDDGKGYAQGIGVDPVGGVEAIISHYLSKELLVPCAHSPAFDDITISTHIVDPRCSAEYITPTFLPCILIGLSKAPRIIKSEYKAGNQINISNLDFLVVPYNSMGGIPVLEANKLGIPVYAVKENKTVLDVTPEKLYINCTILEKYTDLEEICDKVVS